MINGLINEKYNNVNMITMRKKIQHLILGLFLLVGISTVYSQDKYGSDPESCKTNLSIFYEYAKAKSYDAAYQSWMWCMDNCPRASKTIYTYGLKIALDRYNKATTSVEKAEAKALVIRVFNQRIKQYPDHLGRVYSDYANFMVSTGASKDEVFNLLDKAFHADAADMRIKSIYKYFQEITDRNKDNNVQKIFDTYDDLEEAIQKKIDYYSKVKDKLYAVKAAGQELSKRNAFKLHAAEVNSTALEQITGGLDNIIGSIATCDRLLPLYKKNYNANIGNAKWLKRAVSRLHYKECTDDPIYYKMVKSLYTSDPSPQAAVFVAGVSLKKGDSNNAMKYFNQAVAQETDNYKKAGYLYKIAQVLKKSGRKSESRSYAYKALKLRPNMGKAYLLISSLYASSANSCGNDELSKRAVYLAAAQKAMQAKRVEPSIAKLANKYIRSYLGNAPSKKILFIAGLNSGDKYKVACWIRETVTLP